MFTRKSLVLLAGLLLTAALVILASWPPASVTAQGTTPTAVPPTPVPNGPGGGYVGAQVCAACHAPTAHDFAQTGHTIMSRPGFSQYLWKLAQEDQSEVAKIYPGFWDQLVQTMKELDKVGYDANGVVWETPDKWAGKGVDTSKITVWSGGTLPGGDPKTSGLGEFMIKGSALTATDVISLTNAGIYAPDKWYVVGTYLPYKGQGFEGEVVSKEANCATGGCHVTGDQSKIKTSAAWTTGWLTKVAVGQQPDFELGVTCEACHGQGGNHVKAPSSNNIVNPARFSWTQQSVGGDGTVNLTFNSTTNRYAFDATKSYLNASAGAKSCATCHSGNQGEFVIAKTNPPEKKILGTPANTPHYDFTSGTGVNSCVTCHDPHTNSADLGQLTLPTAQKLCTQCHSKVPAITGSATGWEQFMPIPAGDYRHWHGFSYPFPVAR